jgi:hypothetical protein
LAYGYAIESNPHDEYLIKLKIPKDLKSKTGNSPQQDDPSLFVSELSGIKRGGIEGIPQVRSVFLLNFFFN